MKKRLFIVAVIGLMLLALNVSLSGQSERSEKNRGDEVITRTYFLKNVTPDSIYSIVKPYIITIGKEKGSQVMVVILQRRDLDAFESLLERLDKPKRAIHFRIFTVVASNRADGGNGPVHTDLKGVIDEVGKVLGYKHYELDGVSTLTVSDGSRFNEVILNSRVNDLVLELNNISLSDSEEGKAVEVKASLELMEKFGNIIVEKDRQVVNRRLLSVEQMQLVEGGYLVAGVSRLGDKGDALVLVVNATVK